MELQGWQVRILFGRDQRYAAADVHDTARRTQSRYAGDYRTDEGIPVDSRSGDGRFMELRGQEEDQEVRAAASRRERRHVADAAGRRRPGAGVSKVHRVFPVPGRLPRAARSSEACRVYRPAIPGLY